MDDHNNLTYMNITSYTFGRLKIKYDSQTQVPEVYKLEFNALSFDPDTDELLLEISGGVPAILKYTDAIYEIRVTLMDHEFLYAEKNLTLNLTLDHDWYDWWSS